MSHTELAETAEKDISLWRIGEIPILHKPYAFGNKCPLGPELFLFVGTSLTNKKSFSLSSLCTRAKREINMKHVVNLNSEVAKLNSKDQ